MRLSRITSLFTVLCLAIQLSLFLVSGPTEIRNDHSFYCFCQNCPGEELCCCGKGQTPAEGLLLSQLCDQSLLEVILRNAERPFLIQRLLLIPESQPFIFPNFLAFRITIPVRTSDLWEPPRPPWSCFGLSS